MGVATGTRTTQVSLSPVGVLNNIRVDWGADIPEGTSLTIETRYSFDNGTSWSEWQVVDNGEIIITDHTGIDVSNGLLESRQTMTATNVDETPSLNFLKFRCNIRPAQNGARWTIDGLTDVQNMLSSEGTLIFNWVPGFHQSDLADGNHNLLTFSGEVDSGVYVDSDGNLQVSDGINVTSHAIHWAKNQVVKIAITFSGSSVAIKTDLGSGVLTSSTGTFDGDIPSGDNLRIFYRNLYPQWMQSISMYGVVLDDATILEEMGKYSAETDLTDDELADDRLVEYLGQAPHNLHKNLVCYLPLDGSLSDVISGSSVSCVRSGELMRLTDKGVYEAAPANTPAMGKYGVFHDGASTNSLLNNRDLSGVGWGDNLSSKSQDQVGIDGQENRAWTITDNDEFNKKYLQQEISVADDNATHTEFVFVLKDDNESRFPEIYLGLIFGTNVVSQATQINTKTGEVVDSSNDGTSTVYDAGNWWLIVLTLTNNSSGNNTLRFRLYPAASTTLGTTKSSATGSCVIDYPQVELNRSYASSPIETGDSPVSRPTQSADASGNGLSIPLSDLDPRLTACLGGDGAPLGSELVTNGDFSDGTTGWSAAQEGTTLSAVDGVLNIEFDGSQGANPYVYQHISTVAGKTYYIIARSRKTTSGAVTRVKNGSDDIITYSEYYFTFNSGYFVADADTTQIRLKVDSEPSNGDIAYFDNISVREVQPSGTMLVERRPEYSGASDNKGIITVQDAFPSIFYDAYTDDIKSYDGTNILLDKDGWDRNKLSQIAVRWDGITGTFELLRKKEDESSWTINSGTFDGAFDIETHLRLFFDNEYPQWMKNLRFYDKALTTDEIDQEFAK